MSLLIFLPHIYHFLPKCFYVIENWTITLVMYTTSKCQMSTTNWFIISIDILEFIHSALEHMFLLPKIELVSSLELCENWHWIFTRPNNTILLQKKITCLCRIIFYLSAKITLEEKIISRSFTAIWRLLEQSQWK